MYLEIIKMNKKIIFTTGGTGGHIFPAINLMKHFSKKGYKVVLVTDRKGNNFLRKDKDVEFKSYIIKSETPLNKKLIKKFFSFFIIFFSIIKSFFILKKEKPSLIIGFGGYVSFPFSLSSKILNYPLVIYENNLILGRANKYLLPWAKKILISKNIPINFNEKYKKKVFKVGAILKKNIINYSFEKKK